MRATSVLSTVDVVMRGVSAGSARPCSGLRCCWHSPWGASSRSRSGAVAVGWLENLRGVAAYRRSFEVAGSVILIATGLYMLNAVFFGIPGLAA